MKFKVLSVGKCRTIQTSLPSFLVLCSLFVLPLVTVSLLVTPCWAGNSASSSQGKQPEAVKEALNPVDKCFCKIDSGLLEDCPCTTDNIKSFNNENIHKKVMDVLGSNYFRYFQVNFNKPCKFWEHGDGHCSSKNCAVDTCPVDDVPPQVLNHKDQEKDRSAETPSAADHSFHSYLTQKVHEFLPLVEPLIVSVRAFAGDYWPSRQEQCEGEPLPAYSKVDTSLPEGSAMLLNEFCTLDPLESSEGCDYIDLLKNEEKYTGYQGKSSNRIWQKIYSDLCFKPKEGQDMCLEERTFYRIVSGLHTSITVHLCSNYLLQEENIMMGKSAVWGPNIQEFRRRFDPVYTNNQGPEWLKNVHYLYLAELRAIAKAGDLLKSLNYGDEDTREKVGLIVQAAQDFPTSFDESQFFNPEDLSKVELLAQYKAKFRDISHMMDCMGCERCKVWGKLQVTGIGTALKILFTPVGDLRLTRHEVVALINGFGRVTTSIEELDKFRSKV